MECIDFHTHTYHSYDSLMRPEKILRIAKERGLNGIIISDHDTINGGLECLRINKDTNFKVVVASEIYTSVGDITALNIREEIHERNFPDVVRQIKKQGGLVLLVHPYHGHKLSEIDFSAIDLIEGFNARETYEANRKAGELATAHKIPIIAGSDAHIYSEIANARTWFESLNDLSKPLKTECKRNSIYAEIVSQGIKVVKTRSAKNFYKWSLWTPKYLYRRLKEKRP